MKMNKRDLQHALYKNFDLLSESAPPADPEKADELAHAVDNVFGKMDHAGKPDFSEVLRRVREKESKQKDNNIIRPQFGGSKKRWVGAAVAALFLLLLLPLLLFKDQSSPLRLIAWNGTPRITADKKAALLRKENKIAGRISVVTAKGERVLLGIGKSRITIRGRSHLIVAPLQRKGGQLVAGNRIMRGSALFSVDSAKFSCFAVDFPEGKIVVTGTKFAVQVKGKTTKVGVLHGTVKVLLKRAATPVNLKTDTGLIIADGKKEIVSKVTSHPAFSEVFILEKVKPRVMRQQKNKRKRTPVKKFSERVYMKDGTVITGRILLQNRNIIKIKTTYGIISVPWEKVRRVSYIK